MTCVRAVSTASYSATVTWRRASRRAGSLAARAHVVVVRAFEALDVREEAGLAVAGLHVRRGPRQIGDLVGEDAGGPELDLEHLRPIGDEHRDPRRAHHELPRLAEVRST